VVDAAEAQATVDSFLQCYAHCSHLAGHQWRLPTTCPPNPSPPFRSSSFSNPYIVKRDEGQSRSCVMAAMERADIRRVLKTPKHIVMSKDFASCPLV